MHPFDAIDIQLMNLLKQNGRSTIKQLADKVFMSAPAVASRVARLEKSGAIIGYQPVFDLQKLGYNIVAFISLQVTPADKKQFNPFIESVPNVLECSSVTGDYSMLIKVCFHSTMELDAFVGELQRFGKTFTQIVFSTVVPCRGPKLDA